MNVDWVRCIGVLVYSIFIQFICDHMCVYIYYISETIGDTTPADSLWFGKFETSTLVYSVLGAQEL